MSPHMANAKSLAFKRAAIATLDLIGKAVHPSHIKQPYTRKKRDQMIRPLVNFMTTGEVSMKVRALGLAAIITLCRLAPALPIEEESAMLAALLPFFGLRVGQLSAEEDRDNRRRSFVRPQTMIVAGRSDNRTQQALILVHSANHRGAEH